MEDEFKLTQVKMVKSAGQTFSFLSPSVEEDCRDAVVSVWISHGKASPEH